MRRQRAKTYLKAMRHKSFEVKCESASRPAPRCSACNMPGWHAPSGWYGTETHGSDASLTPLQRVERSLHPLPLFAFAGPAGGLLCASCAYSHEQEGVDAEPHATANTPLEALRFRDSTSQPRQVPPVALEDSAPLGAIFNHADQVRDDLVAEGKEWMAHENDQ